MGITNKLQMLAESFPGPISTHLIASGLFLTRVIDELNCMNQFWAPPIKRVEDAPKITVRHMGRNSTWELVVNDDVLPGEEYLVDVTPYLASWMSRLRKDSEYARQS